MRSKSYLFAIYNRNATDKFPRLKKASRTRDWLKITIMGSSTVRPEMTTIAGSLEVARMINGLWQLAGGHDQDIDIAKASESMDAL